MKTLLELIEESPTRPAKGRWPSMKCGAIFSHCSSYRYVLWRVWGTGRSFAHINGLNPSEANHIIDDPTIRREMTFSMSWGLDGLIKTNAFGFCATFPEDMKAHPEPIGLNNDLWIERARELAADGYNIAAWGVDGAHRDRGSALAAKYAWRCFGLTKDGFPKHPLYLPAGTPLVPLNAPPAVNQFG